MKTSDLRKSLESLNIKDVNMYSKEELVAVAKSLKSLVEGEIKKLVSNLYSDFEKEAIIEVAKTEMKKKSPRKGTKSADILIQLKKGKTVKEVAKDYNTYYSAVKRVKDLYL